MKRIEGSGNDKIGEAVHDRLGSLMGKPIGMEG
jgi:hypothetical protein